ncbi:hypothetical protein B0T24DRAFT_314529 [Lasiosphaeria ovina]|uniref:Transmembrane protein n=1 Tax=Lasiosphaeria ovina TaxID=92902 RepID=A0AAE0N5S1_9PEZI|nr:hypothetical protein B0T24DRAFT_314529 [Lasiosphaeria ovina]
MDIEPFFARPLFLCRFGIFFFSFSTFLVIFSATSQIFDPPGHQFSRIFLHGNHRSLFVFEKDWAPWILLGSFVVLPGITWSVYFSFFLLVSLIGHPVQYGGDGLFKIWVWIRNGGGDSWRRQTGKRGLETGDGGVRKGVMGKEKQKSAILIQPDLVLHLESLLISFRESQMGDLVRQVFYTGCFFFLPSSSSSS